MSSAPHGDQPQTALDPLREIRPGEIERLFVSQVTVPVKPDSILIAPSSRKLYLGFQAYAELLCYKIAGRHHELEHIASSGAAVINDEVRVLG